MDLPFLAGLSNIDMLILLGAAVVFLVLAYMIFKQIKKAIIIGAISASIPVALYLLGFNIELSLQSIIWFGLAGIATYFVYDVITGWMKIIRIITWPIRQLFRKGKEKPKEIKPKEEKPNNQKQEKKEDKKEKEKDGKGDKKEEEEKG